ncbi:unnamed protein product [Rotaria sp. Silwood1]|nr:unnamed protein product [Rotaria sp. Silwood1]CAF3570639.1 unnamed protein product [Rotaria sp. Silwood1]CAF3576353.1 unnamed protein product [Rotaria sp. Silwood1]CAF3618818.1 unnamed protein product [Rotaria sp. Silwood1]CAF4537644.1 unnamed protein product [Rotaria sp. Silwood1]
MIKLVIFITFICFGLVATRRPFGRGNHNSDGDRFSSGGDINRWASKLCVNSSLAQLFLTQTRALITQLSSNSSYAQVLQQKAQQIAYIQNDTNGALLSSNCTQYFNGLATARNADMKIQRQQKEYQKIVNRLFKQIIASLWSNGYSSSEDD